MKNFLLYLGNARAGSTWLHGELSRRTDCNFHPQKEIFIFQDYNPVPGDGGFDKVNYFQVMSDLVRGDEILLTGDLTPSNSHATKEQLLWFKKLADQSGFNVLPVMTLRDPIDQVISYSMMNMSTKNFLENNSMDKVKAWFIRQIVTNAQGVYPLSVDEVLEYGIPGFEETLQPWRQTVENATAVFGKIHFNFYETLFTDNSISDLFSYLGLTYENNSIKRREEVDLSFLSDDQILQLMELYPFEKSKYDRAVSLFGKDLIDSVWTDPNQIDYTRKIFSFGKHPEFTDREKQELYSKFPFMQENYEYAIETFGKSFIESIWWNSYK